MAHIPVLLKEVLEYLDPKPNENFVDCTIGEAGHALAILEKTAPKGKVLGIDRDSEVLKNIRTKMGMGNVRFRTELRNRLILTQGNFANLKEIIKREKFDKVSGVLFDLGMSSWHLEKSGRGFSFQRKEPLDMRYDLRQQLTAEKILNFWSKLELERILREYGEERFSRSIAQNIVEARKAKPIKNTIQLVEIIKKSVRGRQKIPRRKTFGFLRGRHPATRTFQALRIAVNDELENLKKGLEQALDVLGKGGRLVVISFHSLEDKIVKNYFKKKTKEGSPIKILTKKPITPSAEEIRQNPRSRSAKLRALCKL